MRIVAAIVLVAMLAAALWLLKPELFQALSPTAPERSPSAGETPPGEPLPRGQLPPPGQDTAAHTGGAADVVSSPAVADASETKAVEQEARQYVRRLTHTEPAPVAADRADHFVSGEQVLKLLPDSAAEVTSLDRLANSRTLEPDTPITVIRNVEQVEQVSPGKLIADSAGNMDAPVQQVLADDSVRETTVRAILDQIKTKPGSVIRVVRDVEYFEQTTPRELLSDPGADRSLPVKIVTAPHGLELSSVRELLPVGAISPDTVFYVRTVRDTDVQGIWGIVHDGIIRNFARGIAIRRGKEINTYQVEIPRDADELTGDARSSFLGRLIFEKSQRSYVYNLRENRMGQNPDRIYPGREIIIINFEPQELIGIYKHFVHERG